MLYNYLRMIRLHFSPPQIRRCITALGDHHGLENTIDRLYESDLFERRLRLDAVRVHDDNWYFKLICPRDIGLLVTGLNRQDRDR